MLLVTQLVEMILAMGLVCTILDIIKERQGK